MDRRVSRRFAVQVNADIEISVSGRDEGHYAGPCTDTFKGIVETIDLSLCGLSAQVLHSTRDTDRSFSPALAYLLVGKEVKVRFSPSGVTVWGRVVRFDPRSMLMAVIITKVADIMSWREFCSRALSAEIAE